MQVVGKDDVGIDLEGMTGADLLDGSQEQRDCRGLFEQRAPVLGDEREEIGTAGDVGTPVSHRAGPQVASGCVGLEFYTRPSILNSARCWVSRALDPTYNLPAILASLAPRHECEALEQMHVLLVLEQGAMQRRNELLGIALAQNFRPDVFDHQELEPVQQF